MIIIRFKCPSPFVLQSKSFSLVIFHYFNNVKLFVLFFTQTEHLYLHTLCLVFNLCKFLRNIFSDLHPLKSIFSALFTKV